ncbi:hypothetical protein [Kitasatospora sp. NPDC050463]|uniref:hypothetical protein n=1 Tax=Kitasatospora sp. NPDC050463 TaxID=3155786 RepID=UPI0033D0644E
MIRNIDDHIVGYTKLLDEMRRTLAALSEQERAAVEEAAREIRKVRSAAAFVP